MSISTVNSSQSYGHLQRLLQPDSASSGDTSPTDALQSLFQAFKGGGPSDALAGLGSDGGSGGAGNGAGTPQFSAASMTALLSAQVGQGNETAANAKAKALIAKFDVDGDGKVSQSEFEEAIGSGADESNVAALFNKLDDDDDGSVSQDELKKALQKARGHRPHHNAGGVNGQQGGNPLQALLSGVSAASATSQSSANTDGSTSTTITYADGTKIEMTIPAASSGTGSDTASGNQNAFNLGNFLKYMVSLQAKLAPPTADLSV